MLNVPVCVEVKTDRCDLSCKYKYRKHLVDVKSLIKATLRNFKKKQQKKTKLESAPNIYVLKRGYRLLLERKMI